MLYNPPTGGAANDPYIGKNVAAGIQGSKIPPAVPEFTQREIVAVIAASGQSPTNTDVQQMLRAVRSGILEYYVDAGAVNAPAIAPSPAHTTLFDGLHVRVRMKSAPTGPGLLNLNALQAPIQRVGGVALAGGEWGAGDVVDLVFNAPRAAFQIDGLTKNDVAAPAQIAYGATAKGGLVLDASENFGFGIITNLNADNRAQPIGADLLPLGRLADGLMVSVSAAALASYVLSNIIAAKTFQQIVANPVLYVRSDGSDTNSGSANTAVGAFKTIAGALAAAISFNFATTSLTIKLGLAGTYVLPGGIVSASGPIIIAGDDSGGTTLTSTGTTVSNASVSFNNLTLRNVTSNNPTVLAQSGGNVTLNSTAVVLAGGGTSSAIQTGPGGVVTINGGVSFAGSGQFALYCNGGEIVLAPTTITVVGNPTFQAFAYAANLGLIFTISGATFSGSAQGSRFAQSSGAVIQSAGGGPNFFPGSTAGTTSTTNGYI